MNVGDPSRSGRFATVTFLKAVLASTSCLLAAVFTIAVASLNAAAQSPPIETQTTEQIVATPISVFSERAQLWPSSTLGDDELSQRLPAQPLSEILSSVPGLQARQNGSPMISIRGSAAADRVLTLYEGIPLNLGDGIGPSDLFLPTETIGRIRIFKGPASVFYGASAMAGALDHETRRFSAPAVRVTAGSYDGFAGEQSALAVAPFGNEKQGGQAAAFYERKPGRYPFTSTSTSITGVRENNASETTRVSAVGNARIGELELHPLFLLARSLGESPTGLAFPSPSTYDSVGLLTGIEASQALTTETRATLRASDVRQWGGFDRGKLTESTSFVSRTMLASDLQENLSPSLVGRTFADYQWDRLAASYLGDASLTQTDFELGQSFSYALSSTLSLEPVLRYRAESGDFFKALGLLRSDESTRSWLTYSEGFRAASLSDRFSNTSFFKGNKGLKPERARSLESGFSSGVEAEGPTFGSTVFVVRYDDLYDTSSLAPGLTTKINTGRGLASGAELSAGYGFTRDRLRADYSYLDAKNEDTGEPLRLSPRHQWALTAEHRFAHAVAELKHTLWSSFFDRDATTNALRELPAWTTFDFTLRSRALKKWELEAGVANLFNVPRELTIGYPEPQRRLFISALSTF